MTRLVALALVLTACDGEQSTEFTQSVMSANMMYHVEVTPDPGPPVAGDVVLDVHVTLHDHHEGVEGATLSVVPWMPMMDHGISEEPTITEGSDGHYDAAFAFSMSGSWEIRMEIDAAGDKDDAVVTLDVQ